MKRILLIAAITAILAFIAFSFLSTGWCYILNDDTLELARRASCMAKQHHIFQALENYRKNQGCLPSNLSILVQKQYITNEYLYCCEPSKNNEVRLYKYLPENYGNANLPLVYESTENHSKGLRLKRLKPIVIQTMGNGQVVKIDIKDD